MTPSPKELMAAGGGAVGSAAGRETDTRLPRATADLLWLMSIDHPYWRPMSTQPPYTDAHGGTTLSLGLQR
jgi:hypothetical protein